MIAKNFDDVKDDFEAVFDQATMNEETIFVARKKENVVIMSLSEYNNLLENLHIRKSTANYDRLLESIKQAERGQLKEFNYGTLDE